MVLWRLFWKSASCWSKRAAKRAAWENPHDAQSQGATKELTVLSRVTACPSSRFKTAVGQLLYAIQKLIENEQYDKAVTALTNLFKIERL